MTALPKTREDLSTYFQHAVHNMQLTAVVECPGCGLYVKAQWPGKENCPKCGEHLGQWPGWGLEPTAADIAACLAGPPSR
jgi:uncharacterized paraquat-inducible protein A